MLVQIKASSSAVSAPNAFGTCARKTITAATGAIAQETRANLPIARSKCRLPNEIIVFRAQPYRWRAAAALSSTAGHMIVRFDIDSPTVTTGLSEREFSAAVVFVVYTDVRTITQWANPWRFLMYPRPFKCCEHALSFLF